MKNFFYWLLCLMPLGLLAADPVFYMPLDDSAQVVGRDDAKCSPGIISGRGNFQPGVIGKGLDISRHAYDQVTALNFTKLPAVNCNEGTVAFWFKPHWSENSPESNWIFSGRDVGWKGFRFYLIKGKNGVIELSICSPDQIQILKQNLFKQDTWTHVAFSWDGKKSEVNFFINGKEVAKRAIAGKFKLWEKPMPLLLSCGQEGSDRFKANVGNGVYDEIKIFDRALSAPEIFQLSTGGGAEKNKPLSLSSAVCDDKKVAFVFQDNNEAYSGPRKLFTLQGESPRKQIGFIAMGANRKLSMVAENDGVIKAVETTYTFPLNQPHKIQLHQNAAELTFVLDDAVQGTVRFDKPFGKIISAEGVDSISFSAPAAVPGKSEVARLEIPAASPLEKSFWSLDGAERRKDGVRSGVTLNGYWRVMPVNDYTYAPPVGEWGYTRVPGSFRSPLWKIYRDQKGQLESVGDKWNGKTLGQYRAAWYQRTFEVPAKFQKSGRIYLNFTNLNGDNGRVYLNGKLIDSFRQDFKGFTEVPNQRRLDITDCISNDTPNTLTVFVDRHYVGLWRGQLSIGDHSEIAMEDVLLETAPATIAVKTAIALPSF